jgi:hypothetical protein
VEVGGIVTAKRAQREPRRGEGREFQREMGLLQAQLR